MPWLQPKEAIKDVKTKTKVWPCDNCGRAHWGYYAPESWEFPDIWTFEWTTPQGRNRTGTPC